MGIECCKCSKLYDGKKASIYSKNTEVSDYKKAPHESRHNSGISADEIKLRAKNAVGVGVEEPLGCWASCFPWAWKKEKENPTENPKSDDTAVLLVSQLTNSSSKRTSQELSERDPVAVELNDNVVQCEIEKCVETEDTSCPSSAKQVKVKIVQQAKPGMCEVELAESTSKKDILTESTCTSNALKASREKNAKTNTCEEKEDILTKSTSNAVKTNKEQKAKSEICEEKEDIRTESTLNAVKASREQTAESISLDLEQRSNAVRQTNYIDDWMNWHTVHDAKLSKSTMSARDVHMTKKRDCICYVKASTSKSWSRHLVEHNIGHDLKTSCQKYKGQRVIGAVVSPKHEREMVENVLTEVEGVQMHRQNGIGNGTMNKHVVLVIVCLLLLGVASTWVWNFYNQLQRDFRCHDPLPPGNFGIPVFGETISLLMQGSTFYDYKQKQHGRIYKTHLFGSPIIRVVGEENVQLILSGENDIVTSYWPKSTRLLLGDGLVLEKSGPSHSHKKRAILKAFTHKALDGYIPVLVTTCQNFIDAWCQKGRITMYPELRFLTYSIACKALAGFNLAKDEVHDDMQLFEDFVNGIFSLPLNLPGSGLRKALKAREKLLEKIEACINSLHDGECPNILAFLYPLCTAGNLDRASLKYICLDLLFASHETTTSAACFLLLYLSRNEMILTRLEEELCQNDIFAKAYDSNLTFEDVNGLITLRNIVKETIRLCCPIGAGFRKVIKTFSLEGYQIPKDWLLAYSIRESTETSSFFTSPREFNPDRWNNVDDNSRHFLCFGGGKRRCVGKDFSMLLLKIFIIEMIRKCVWKIDDLNPRIIGLPTPHPYDGMPVSIAQKKNETA